VHSVLEQWSALDLAHAICDDEMESLELMDAEQMRAYEEGRIPLLMQRNHKSLLASAFELMVENDRVVRGRGYVGYCIDREACHQVRLPSAAHA